MTRREERAIRSEARALVAEAGAILSGQLANRRWQGQNQPGWVCLNTLAHADWKILSRPPDGRGWAGYGDWREALTLLSSELRSHGPDGAPALQREVLVPLELDVLAGRAPMPASPAQLVVMIRLLLAQAARRRGHTGASSPARQTDG